MTHTPHPRYRLLGLVVGWLLCGILLAPLATAVMTGMAGWSMSGFSRHVTLLGDTLLFATLASSVAVIGGIIIGRAGWHWAVLACLPMALPASLLASAWIVLLGRTGPLGAWVSVFDRPVAALVVGLRYLGIPALIFATQRDAGGPAARLYRPRLAWWWFGVVPRIKPALAGGCLVLLICAADPIMPSMLLVQTFGTQLLIQYNALQDLPGAAALVLPMLIPAVVTAELLLQVIIPDTLTETYAPKSAGRFSACGILLLAVGLPLGAVVICTGSPAVFIEAWGNLRHEAIHTARVGLIGTLACVTIGTMLAVMWLSAYPESRSPAGLILVNLAVPAAMIGLGMIQMSSHWPLSMIRDTDAFLIWAYVVRFSPVAMLVVYMAALKRHALPTTAARVHRVSWLSRLWKLYWPMYRGPLAGAALLCGVLIVTELEMSLLLSPAGSSTLGVRLYTLIHTAPADQVSAAALATLTMLMPLLAVTLTALRRTREASA